MLSFVPHSRIAVIYGAAQGFSIPVQAQTEENNPCMKGKSLNNSMHCIIILVGGKKPSGQGLVKEEVVFLWFSEISVHLLKGRKCQTAFQGLSKSSFG